MQMLDSVCLLTSTNFVNKLDLCRVQFLIQCGDRFLYSSPTNSCWAPEFWHIKWLWHINQLYQCFYTSILNLSLTQCSVLMCDFRKQICSCKGIGKKQKLALFLCSLFIFLYRCFFCAYCRGALLAIFLSIWLQYFMSFFIVVKQKCQG